MDFVKREDQNTSDEDHQYKAYLDSLQKHQLDSEYQHTPISVEQLHQAMQSSLTANSLHNFQLPLSPRQMSTLMLKTNHLSRNLNFNELPAHLPRNLTNVSQELDLIQTLAHDLPQGLRHDELLGQNLMIARNLSQDLDLQTNLTQTIIQNQNLTEQELTRNLSHDLARNLSSDLCQNLSRIHDILPQNLRMDLPHNLSHDLNITHLSRQNLGQEALDETRRAHMAIAMQIDQMMEHNLPLGQNLTQNQRINQSLTQNQRIDQSLTQNQRINQNLTQNQRIEHSLTQSRLATNSNIHEPRIEPTEHMLPMPFHIKAEQEDEYFYDNVNHNQGLNINGLNGDVAVQNEHQPNQNDHSYNQMYVYSQTNSSTANIPALNPIDMYTRPQNYVQNYAARENPQNLVIQKYENSNAFGEDYKKLRQDGAHQNGGKEKEQPKENLKPSDQNKIFFNEFNQNYADSDKNNENNPTDNKLVVSEDLSLIKGEYICYKCNQIFPSKRGLKTHSKICSDAENEDTLEKLGKFACTQCSYRCQSPAILKIHERTHTGEKPFSCTFCDYKSGQKNNVAKHILVHMKEKPFRCQYCDYRCAQKNNLVVHERTHTGYKPFACSYCDYRTVQKPNLVKHMYLHTDQKPFSCDQCSYRCVQKTNLTKHKLRHLNEKDGEKVDFMGKSQVKPYRPRQKSVKCPYCAYKCVQKSSLEKHMQFKHAGQSHAEFLQENFDQNTLQMDENTSQEIQNLSVKKDPFDSNDSEKNEAALTTQS